MLADAFFPDGRREDDDADHRGTRRKVEGVNNWSQNEICDPPFIKEELVWAALSFNSKKAPGIGVLMADIGQKAITLNPDLILAITNKCLQLLYFPKIWKGAVVVTLRKSDKDTHSTRTPRPIG